MTDVVVVLLLVAHGLVHLAVYLTPAPAGANGKPPPFDPSHSWALTASHVAHDTEVAVARALAVTAALGFVVAGIGVAFGAAWAAGFAVAAAAFGLVLKGLYFNPWLSVGVLIDCAVIAVAVSS